MPAQPSLSARARWIIRTQLAAVTPGHRHTPGGLIWAAAAEAAAQCDDRIGTDHLLLALFRADDPAAAQALAQLGADEAQVRGTVESLRAEYGQERSA